MPELPEVETVVRDLQAAGLAGRTVRATEVFWNRTIASPSVRAFRQTLPGTKITGIARRAKYILIRLDSGSTLLIHLRMSGRLELGGDSDDRHPHVRIVLRLDDGHELRFIDQRKFGRWWLTDAPENVLGRLGPEPLSTDFTPAAWRAAVSPHRRMLKPMLLDQHVIAGLGNIYVDEALWEAGLHPKRLSHELTPQESAALYRSVRKVLRRGIRSMGTSLGNTEANFYSVSGRRGRNQDGLRVFRRTGEPCPRCGTPVARILVAQRSSHFCPACQHEDAPGGLQHKHSGTCR